MQQGWMRLLDGSRMYLMQRRYPLRLHKMQRERMLLRKEDDSMQQPVKHPRLQAFVSLSWYAGLISFLFRFLAMTSEPLLALGVILSAADFLQQGHLMAH